MPKQSLITGAAALLISQAIVLGLGYITHPLIGRLLGPASYGIYGVVLSVQTIVSMVLTLGIPIAISRFVAQDEDHARSILYQAIRLQFYLAFLLAALTLLISPLIAALLQDDSLSQYIRFVALILIFQAPYPIFAQYLSGLRRFYKQAALSSIYAVAKLAGTLLLLYFWHLYGALAGFGVGGAIAGFVGWRMSRHSGGTSYKTLPIKTFLSFAGTYVLILIGLQVLMSLDLFMVKAFLKNDELAGYYSAAVNLSRISYFLLQAVAFVLLPSVSALTKPGQSHDLAALFIRDAFRYLIALIIPSVSLAAATSKSLVLLFFSEQYLPAAPLLTILMIGLGSLGFYLMLANIVSGAGSAAVGLVITGCLLLVSTLLGWMLIPPLGLIGAAWQTTTTGLIGLAVIAAYTFKKFAIPVPLRSTLNIILATALAILPTYLWQPIPYLLPLYYLVLGALYLVGLLLVGEITRLDRQRIAALHPRLLWLAKNA